jgi:hypothetical protein
VFVFAANPWADGTRALQIISTTVVRIQRYTTSRLRYQGIYLARPSGDSLLVDTLRAHFRAQQEDTVENVQLRRERDSAALDKTFPNGAADLSGPPEFIIADPDLTELENLFSMPDQRHESDSDERDD